MQKFYEVYFDENPLFTGLTGYEPREIHNRLFRYSLPIYGSLNGGRKGGKGYLRRMGAAYGEYRGVVIKLISKPDDFVDGSIINNGERGPFTGVFLYTSLVVDPQTILDLPYDKDIIGRFTTDIYEKGLAKLRGNHGLPNDFLCDFFQSHAENGYITKFEHKHYSFPEHGISARFVSECGPTQERYFLCVKRLRRKIEHRIHVGTIGRAAAMQMHGAVTFDGKTFKLSSWLQEPNWPVSYTREHVEISEFGEL